MIPSEFTILRGHQDRECSRARIMNNLSGKPTQLCNEVPMRSSFMLKGAVGPDVELLHACASNNPDVIKFLVVMTVLNTVIPLESKDGSMSYKAQSQDEKALVHAAAHMQMVLFNGMGNMLCMN